MKQTSRHTPSPIPFVLAVWASPGAADGPAPTKPATRLGQFAARLSHPSSRTPE